MDVKRTKELLGKKVAKLSDEEIVMLISRTKKTLNVLFEITVGKIKKNKL